MYREAHTPPSLDTTPLEEEKTGTLPGRGRSCKPFTPCLMKRLAHLRRCFSQSGADADVDADGGDFSIASALGWLGIGKAPLVLLLAADLSLWGLFGWMLNVAVGTPTNWLAGVVMGVSGVGAIVAGGLLAQPIGKVFASFAEDASSDRPVGCIRTVSTIRIPLAGEGKVGQVDVLDPARNLVTVNAVLPDWAIAMPERGDKVIVIDRASEAYIVITRDSPDQERWLSRSSS